MSARRCTVQELLVDLVPQLIWMANGCVCVVMRVTRCRFIAQCNFSTNFSVIGIELPWVMSVNAFRFEGVDFGRWSSVHVLHDYLCFERYFFSD